MRKETNNTDVIRFLKDEKFIEWKLFSTDELDAHWHDFLQQHSDQRKNIELAEEHFRKINISSHKLPREKKREAIARLEQSLRAYRRKHRIRRLAYAAACAAVLILSILYIQKEINPPGQGAAASENYIVGNELEQEDILFITGKRSATFLLAREALLFRGTSIYRFITIKRHRLRENTKKMRRFPSKNIH